MIIKIEQANQIDQELVQAFRRLMPQLSPTATPPDLNDLIEMTRSGNTVILIARDLDDQTIAGTLTLVLVHTPTGKRTWIEDVVVDQAYRGKGVGEALSRTAVQLSRDYGATSVNLTSRPEREAANRLYQRIGFERRHTNLYRLTLK